MPNLLDHLTLRAMQLRGYRRHRVHTDAGTSSALVWDGDGPLPPLVLVHGWASAGVHHVLSARALRKHVRRLVIPDLPGHGFSAAPPRLTPEAVGAGLTQTLDALIDEPAVLLGSSLGGLASVRYALRSPHNVRGLILVSPFGAPVAAGDFEALLRVVSPNNLRQTKDFLDRLGPRPRLSNWLFAPEMLRILKRPVFRGLLESASETPLLSRHELESLQIPVTVIWGTHEALLPESHLDFWSSIPGVEILRPERSGHSPALDEPRWFHATVLSRLAAGRQPGTVPYTTLAT